MYVVGTAGHVDHGKSALVRALTNIDPDRLREEKERGLTIDLGFAWLNLPSGRDVSVVDVPGHERFIKNMLAGAGGVDLALLVVAADEGPMLQTHEHLAILDLLDVPEGVVAITKCDLVEEEYVDLVEAEIVDTLAGTRLEGSPIVRTSATIGEGLNELVETLDRALDITPAKRDLGRPRLPIDRAFTIRGFGAVVTGTLLDGSLSVGQEVEIQPGGLRGRIRGLQRHGEKAELLSPGTRAAVNLSGIRTEQLRRGMVLSSRDVLTPAHSLDVRLKATALLSKPLVHDSGVTFLSATAESEAKVRFLDRDELGAGETGWAQLVLETPVAVLPHDSCVVRSPNETVAGGPIVAVNPRRHRRNHLPTLEALGRQLEAPPAERLADLLAAGPLSRSEVGPVLGLQLEQAASAVDHLLEAYRAVEHGPILVGSPWLTTAAAALVQAVEDYLDEHPLRSVAPREYLRSRLALEPNLFALVVAETVRTKDLVEGSGGGLHPLQYVVMLSKAQEEQVAVFMAAIKAGG
ncbi:MAG TPA: selenocysteine-specific translation elongation factor, partial [Dehalococcoidia bacterium]|nr:selenocysteine-specific translation elongation factor [Dehalococcoidia bacterium]